MSKKYLNIHTILAILIFGIFLTACGKVSQDVGVEEKDQKAFDLNYSLEVYSTSNLFIVQKQNIATQDIFMVSNDPLYVLVQGIKLDNAVLKQDELSWGKAVLVVDKIPQPLSTANAQLNSTDNVTGNFSFTSVLSNYGLATANQLITYTAKCFDKNGVTRTAADYSWTTAIFDNSKQTWQFTSKKIRLGYPRYLIAVYNGNQNYYLKILDNNQISEKSVNNIGQISLYDTFLANLFLLDLGSAKKINEDFLSIKDLGLFFNEKFYSTLAYQKTKNKTKKFDLQKPFFTLDQEQGSALLKTYSLAKTDSKEAINYLKNLKAELIPTAAVEILIKKLEE